jgi:hypothetical protein
VSTLLANREMGSHQAWIMSDLQPNRIKPNKLMKNQTTQMNPATATIEAKNIRSILKELKDWQSEAIQKDTLPRDQATLDTMQAIKSRLEDVLVAVNYWCIESTHLLEAQRKENR